MRQDSAVYHTSGEDPAIEGEAVVVVTAAEVRTAVVAVRDGGVGSAAPVEVSTLTGTLTLTIILTLTLTFTLTCNPKPYCNPHPKPST